MSQLKIAHNVIINGQFPYEGFYFIIKHKKGYLSRSVCLKCNMVSKGIYSECPHCHSKLVPICNKFELAFSEETNDGLKVRLAEGDIQINDADLIVDCEYIDMFTINKKQVILNNQLLYKDWVKIIKDPNLVVANAINEYIPSFSDFYKTMFLAEGAYTYYFIALAMKKYPEIYNITLNKPFEFSKIFHEACHDRKGLVESEIINNPTFFKNFS